MRMIYAVLFVCIRISSLLCTGNKKTAQGRKVRLKHVQSTFRKKARPNETLWTEDGHLFYERTGEKARDLLCSIVWIRFAGKLTVFIIRRVLLKNKVFGKEAIL